MAPVANMYRWTARVALLIMLVPSFGPLALAGVAAQERMQCCIRRPLTGARAAAAEPAMPCHHSASKLSQDSAEAEDIASPEASFRSVNCCGQRCECCRNSKTSEWARLASRHLSFVSFHIEPGIGPSTAAHVSAPLIDSDSARAPPHS